MNRARFLAPAAIALLFALEAAAAPITVRNGTVKVVAPLPSLSAQVSGAGTAWVAWMIAPSQERRMLCSYGDDYSIVINDEDRDVAAPILTMIGVTDGQVDDVRLYTMQCPIDAHGRNVYWIDGVDPRQSLAFLRSLALRDESRVAKRAVTAVAMHEGSEETLLDLAKNTGNVKARGQALFWLGQVAGVKAAGVLREAADDPNDDIKAKAVFGISQLPNDESIPLLVDLMKNHKSRVVRKKAAFWLGQKNDPRALAELERFLRQ